MLIHGLAQPPDVRLVGGVIRRQVELIVGGGERPRLLDLGGDDGAQPVEPCGADVAGHGEEAVLEVPLARALVQHQRARVAARDSGVIAISVLCNNV